MPSVGGLTDASSGLCIPLAQRYKSTCCFSRPQAEREGRFPPDHVKVMGVHRQDFYEADTTRHSTQRADPSQIEAAWPFPWPSPTPALGGCLCMVAPRGTLSATSSVQSPGGAFAPPLGGRGSRGPARPVGQTQTGSGTGPPAHPPAFPPPCVLASISDLSVYLLYPYRLLTSSDHKSFFLPQY